MSRRPGQALFVGLPSDVPLLTLAEITTDVPVTIRMTTDAGTDVPVETVPREQETSGITSWHAPLAVDPETNVTPLGSETVRLTVDAVPGPEARSAMSSAPGADERAHCSFARARTHARAYPQTPRVNRDLSAACCRPEH
jgi:hypothetical protein